MTVIVVLICLFGMDCGVDKRIYRKSKKHEKDQIPL